MSPSEVSPAAAWVRVVLLIRALANLRLGPTRSAIPLRARRVERGQRAGPGKFTKWPLILDRFVALAESTTRGYGGLKHT
jgi:hypothetical protein